MNNVVRLGYPETVSITQLRRCVLSVDDGAADLTKVISILQDINIAKQAHPTYWELEKFPFLRIAHSMRGSRYALPTMEIADPLLHDSHLRLIKWLLRPEGSLSDLRIISNQFRRTHAFSVNDRGEYAIRYLPISEIVPALIMLRDLVCHPGDERSLGHILLAFGLFLGIHPFVDGNGRAARTFLAEALRALNLWDEAPFPVAFLTYRDRKRYVAHCQALLLGNKCDDFIAYFSQLVSAAAELSLLSIYVDFLRGKE